MFFIYLFGMDSIYIWSSTFDSIDNKTLNKLTKKYDNILISSLDTNKLFDFINLTEKRVYFLISNNKWIYTSNRYKIDEKLKYLSNFHNYYIHLDIEPHAIPALKPYRKKYLSLYIEMLKYIKTNYPKFHIDTSIPTFYDVEYVKKMDKYIENIYLMAYKYKNMHQLIKRVKKYEQFNIFVVFNCKDYKGNQLKNDVLEFTKITGIKNIAYHSLKYCKELN
jgi:hypothetical protein